MPATPASEPVKSGGIDIGDVGGSVNFSALGDIVGGDKITTITTTIQISVEAITQRPLVTTSPYRGLDRFEDRDKDLFFGRDQLIKSLLAQLGASNVLLVLGASGSGKSSVVRAGLLPALSQLIGARFRYFTFVPDVNPFESLRSALQGAGFSQAQTRELLDAHPETPAKLIHTLQREGDQWLFFVDQFEEIFTVCDEALRKTFIAALVAIAQDTASSTKLVLAMRADFLDRFSPFPLFAKIIEKNIDFVADMHPDELRLAIEQPAARHGVVFEQGLVEEIIKDVQGQAGSLPLLQYTLDLLWQEEARENGLADRHLNTRAYRELGGVRGALQKRANEIYASFGDGTDAKAASPKQEIVRQIFLRLVDLAGEGSNDAAWRPVRRRAPMAMFATAQEQEILRALIDQKLLVSNREGEDATVEVAHEALFTSWGRLKNWIEAGKQVIFARNRLADDARRWQRHQQEDPAGAEEELLSGTRLAQALDMRARGDFVTVVGGLSETETQFLDTSAALRDRRRQEEEERQKRELEAAQRLAEARTLAAGRLRKGLAIAVVLLIATLGAVFYARSSAQKTRQTLTDADFRQAVAMVEQSKVGEALAHLARAVRTSPGNRAATDRIFSLLAQRRFLLPASAPAKIKGRITSLRFTPDGRCLVAAVSGVTAQVFDARSGQPLTAPFQHDGKVRVAQLSPDAKFLATARGDGSFQDCDVWPYHRGQDMSDSADSSSVRVWEVATGKPLSGPLTQDKTVVDVRFSHDGTRVVTADDDQTARVWDVRAGEQRAPPLQHESAVFSAQFSPDDQRIITSSQSLNIWDAKTGGRTTAPSSDNRATSVMAVIDDEDRFRATAAEYSPDGAFIAVVFEHPGGDPPWQTVEIINAKTGKKIGEDRDSGYPVVTSINFTPDGKHVLASYAGRNRNKDDTGGIDVIEVATGSSIFQLPTEGTPVTPVHCAMALPHRGEILAALGDRTLQLWKDPRPFAYAELEPPILPVKFPGHPFHLASEPSGAGFVVFFKDSDAADANAENTWVQFWNLPTVAERSVVNSVPRLPPGPPTIEDQEAEIVSDTSRDGRRMLKLKATLVTICDAKSGQQIGAQIRPEADYGGFFGMQTAKFSPDGRLVATGEGGDYRLEKGFARIWDASTGQPLSGPLVHHNAVISATFTADSERLVTIESNLTKSNRSVARVWDIRTGLLLTDVLRGKVVSHSAQFSLERGQLTGLSFGYEEGSDDSTEVWDLAFPPGAPAPDWLPRLAEIVGGYELNAQTGALEPAPDRWQGLEAMRKEFSVSRDKDPFTTFGKWFLANPHARTISPFSEVTVAEYIDRCIARGGQIMPFERGWLEENWLQDAEALAAGDEALTAKVAAKPAASPPPAQPDSPETETAAQAAKAQAEEIDRKQEEERDRKQKAEAAVQAEEVARKQKAEAAAQAEEVARRQEEERDRKRRAEAAAQAEEVARKQEEERDRKQKAEAAVQAEEVARKQEEERDRKQKAEAAAQAEEVARKQEEARNQQQLEKERQLQEARFAAVKAELLASQEKHLQIEIARASWEAADELFVKLLEGGLPADRLSGYHRAIAKGRMEQKLQKDPKDFSPPDLPASGFFDLDALFATGPYASYVRASKEKMLKATQKRLKAENLFQMEIDGVPSVATEKALIAFQRKNGIPLSGRLDLRTAEALGLMERHEIKAHSPPQSSKKKSTSRPKPSPSSSPRQAKASASPSRPSSSPREEKSAPTPPRASLLSPVDVILGE